MCVILHMSVITQRRESALMKAARWGNTEVVVELVRAGANVDMQNEVRMSILILYVIHLHIPVCTCICNYWYVHVFG